MFVAAVRSSAVGAEEARASILSDRELSGRRTEAGLWTMGMPMSSSGTDLEPGSLERNFCHFEGLGGDGEVLLEQEGGCCASSSQRSDHAGLFGCAILDSCRSSV